MATSPRIVVADDNRDAADSLAQLMQLLGYAAIAVYDGQQAVDACLAYRPQLAILDVQMPIMNGCDAARRIRDGGGPPPWLASLTGLKLEDEPLRSGCHLFDAHLSKPVQMDEFQQLLIDKVKPLGDGEADAESA